MKRKELLDWELKAVKGNATMEIMQIDAPKQVWRCLKVDASGKLKDESEYINVEVVCAVSVNLNLKCSVTYPSTKATHYKLERPI